MSTVYSTSLAHDEVVAAEMCLDTTLITLDEPHVIDLITDFDSSTSTTNRHVKISQTDFEEMFYGRNTGTLAANVGFEDAW